MTQAKAYKGWHHTEAVTLTFVRDTEIEVSVAIAKRFEITEKNLMVFGAVRLTGNEVIFDVPVDLLEADDNFPGDVQSGDKITDANTPAIIFIVKHYRLLSYGTRYRLLCSQSRPNT